MPGVAAFAGAALGFESTAGTAVAATEVLRMPAFFLTDDGLPSFANEQIGIATRVGRPYIAKQLAMFQTAKHEATFEQLPYWLAMGVKNVVTGVQDGSGTDYIYAYPLPTTAYPTIKPATLEGYDNQQEYESAYCFTSEIKLSGKGGESWMCEAKGFGRAVAKSTKTGSLTPPSVEEIKYYNTSAYIDVVSGSMGATQQLLTLSGFEITLKTFWRPDWKAEGATSPYFTLAIYTPPPGEAPITGKLMLEHTAYETAQHTLYQAGTPRLLRIKGEGNTVGTPGTTYSKKTVLIDMPITWTKFSEPKEQDGNHIIDAEFMAQYDLTASLGPSITVVNERSAL